MLFDHPLVLLGILILEIGLVAAGLAMRRAAQPASPPCTNSRGHRFVSHGNRLTCQFCGVLRWHGDE